MLLTQLVAALKEEVVKEGPAWHNLIYIAYMVEELILCSHAKEVGDDSKGLLTWVEPYLLYYFGSNEKSLWAEWGLLEGLFTTFEAIYPEWSPKEEEPDVGSVFNLLEAAQNA